MTGAEVGACPGKCWALEPQRARNGLYPGAQLLAPQLPAPSGLSDCKKRAFCCSKLLSLWPFITVALGS